MEPTLLVGDRIFVSKFSYGYSKHSFPFSPNLSNNRYFSKKPQQGDLVVFKTPSDNRTDYIKRLIGLPGDEIQFKEGNLYINGKMINLKDGKGLVKAIKYLISKKQVNIYKFKNLQVTINSPEELRYARLNYKKYFTL